MDLDDDTRYQLKAILQYLEASKSGSKIAI